MKFGKAACITPIALFTLFATPARLAAQQPKRVNPHFKFVDLGTLGGPQSSLFGGSRVLNSSGTVAFGGGYF